jgi:nucleoid DNA-binding protein
MAFNKKEVKSTEDISPITKEIVTNFPMILNNSALVAELQEELALTKANTEEVIKTVASGMRNVLVAKGFLDVPGLGRFYIKDVGEREYTTKLTGEVKKYIVPAHSAIVWRTSKSLTLASDYKEVA